MNSEILRLNEQYAFIPKRVMDVGQYVDSRLLSLVSFTRTEDGWYYILDKSDRSLILGFNPHSGERRSISFKGAIGQIGSDGRRLYATDYENGRIVLLKDDRQVEEIGSGFQYPFGMAFGADEIFMTDYLAHKVYAFDATGRSRCVLDTGIKNPTGLAIQPDGNIWVVSSGSGQLVRCDSAGNIVSLFGNSGCLDHEFNIPSGVALTADGQLLVCDAYNGCVKKMSTDGEHVFSIYGFLDHEMVSPQSIIVRDGLYSVCCSHSLKIFEFEL